MKNLLTEFNNETNKPLVLLMALTLFLSPLLYFDSLLLPSELPRYVLISVTALLAPLLLVIHLWRNPDEQVWHQINTPIILFACVATISGLWAVDMGSYYLSIVPFTALICIYFRCHPSGI